MELYNKGRTYTIIISILLNREIEKLLAILFKIGTY